MVIEICFQPIITFGRFLNFLFHSISIQMIFISPFWYRGSGVTGGVAVLGSEGLWEGVKRTWRKPSKPLQSPGPFSSPGRLAGQPVSEASAGWILGHWSWSSLEERESSSACSWTPSCPSSDWAGSAVTLGSQSRTAQDWVLMCGLNSHWLSAEKLKFSLSLKCANLIW